MDANNYEGDPNNQGVTPGNIKPLHIVQRKIMYGGNTSYLREEKEVHGFPGTMYVGLRTRSILHKPSRSRKETPASRAALIARVHRGC